MILYTYRFPTHWTTTDEELTGYIERFEVTPIEVSLIEGGDMPDEVLAIEDPYIEPEPVPEPEPEIITP